MPVTKIEVRRSWPPEKQQFLIDAAHAVLVETLKIPQHDRLIRFVEHRAEHFAVPPGHQKTTPWSKSPCFRVDRWTRNENCIKALLNGSVKSVLNRVTFALFSMRSLWKTGVFVVDFPPRTSTSDSTSMYSPATRHTALPRAIAKARLPLCWFIGRN